MKKLFKIKFLLPVVFFMTAMQVNVNATHIIGGDLSYTCLGDDWYEIRIELRRDCENGQAPWEDLLHVSLWSDDFKWQILPRQGDAKQNAVRFHFADAEVLSEDVNQLCGASNIPVCVERSIYTSTVRLHPFEPGSSYYDRAKDGIRMVFMECCRNETLSNIQDPLATGMRLEAFLSPQTLASCNSAPAFQAWPEIYICVGEELTFNHAVTDPDGDDITYSLCTPWTGGSQSDPDPIGLSGVEEPELVQWIVGFDQTNMLGGAGANALSIDPNTGILTATPTMVGQYAVAICIEERRGGELMSMTRRDFQYNVSLCGAQPDVEVSVDGSVCELNGNNTFTANLENADAVEWLFDYPDQTVGSTDLSTSYGFPAEGVYTIAVVAINTNLDCTDTTFVDVPVFDSGLSAEFTSVGGSPGCDSQGFDFTDISSGNYNITEWEWSTGGQTSSDQNPSFEFDALGANSVTLTVTDENGCTATFTDDVDVTFSPQFEVMVTGNEDDLCAAGNVILTASSDDDNVTFVWTDQNGNTVTGPTLDVDVDQTSTVSVVGTNADGCTVTATETINLIDFEVMVDGPGTAICSSMGDVFLEATTNSANDLTYEWEPSNSIVSGGDTAIPEVNPDETTTYSVTVTDQVTGCTDTDVYTVDVQDIDIGTLIGYPSGTIDTFIYQGESYQFPFGNLLPDNLEYSWTPVDGLDNPNSGSPNASPTESTVYTLTATDPLSGCTGTLTVDLEVRNALCNMEDVFIPNAFSPNGDGINDVFHVESNVIDELELIIYNRWGQEIFRANSQDATWDGTFDGKELSPDVYAYCLEVFCLGDPRERYYTQGNITLLK